MPEIFHIIITLQLLFSFKKKDVHQISCHLDACPVFPVSTTERRSKRFMKRPQTRLWIRLSQWIRALT